MCEMIFTEILDTWGMTKLMHVILVSIAGATVSSAIAVSLIPNNGKKEIE